MQHMIFGTKEHSEYQYALLIKGSAFKKDKLFKHYIDPLVQAGINPDSIIGISLDYPKRIKISAKQVKQNLTNVLKICNYLKVKTILVADGEHFKKLTSQGQVEKNYGYIFPCTYEGNDHIQAIPLVNYQQFVYKPATEQLLELGLKACIADRNGNYRELGKDIFHSEEYPTTPDQNRK